MSIMEKFKLDGKTALVTGCSKGIGFGIAKGLAEAGQEGTAHCSCRYCARGSAACSRRGPWCAACASPQALFLPLLPAWAKCPSRLEDATLQGREAKDASSADNSTTR